MDEDEEPNDVPPCRSCGVPWVDHLGMTGTCGRLTTITRQVHRLRDLVRQGPIDQTLLNEILDTILRAGK